jgi:hypothetical protein
MWTAGVLYPARPPFFLSSDEMNLLYLDDSGSVQNAADRHIVLAGIAMFERQPHWFAERLETLAGKVWPESDVNRVPGS